MKHFNLSSSRGSNIEKQKEILPVHRLKDDSCSGTDDEDVEEVERVIDGQKIKTLSQISHLNVMTDGGPNAIVSSVMQCLVNNPELNYFVLTTLNQQVQSSQKSKKEEPTETVIKLFLEVFKSYNHERLDEDLINYQKVSIKKFSNYFQ